MLLLWEIMFSCLLAVHIAFISNNNFICSNSKRYVINFAHENITAS